MSGILSNLQDRLFEQRSKDNKNLVLLNLRYFVVTPEELEAVTETTGRSRLLGYQLVLSQDEIPEPPTFEDTEIIL